MKKSGLANQNGPKQEKEKDVVCAPDDGPSPQSRSAFREPKLCKTGLYPGARRNSLRESGGDTCDKRPKPCVLQG